MAKIKVLLSSRPKLLSEVIRNMLEHQPDMEVVGEVIDPIELLRAVWPMVVNVVIVTPLKANGEPKICRHLLLQHPLLIIVTQSAEAEAAYLYRSGVRKQRLDDPSERSILSAIREAMRPTVN
jgi:DNA-binding NarL/FixJ family response regulator